MLLSLLIILSTTRFRHGHSVTQAPPPDSGPFFDTVFGAAFCVEISNSRKAVRAFAVILESACVVRALVDARASTR